MVGRMLWGLVSSNVCSIHVHRSGKCHTNVCRNVCLVIEHNILLLSAI
jgi:hypothetical protein